MCGSILLTKFAFTNISSASAKCVRIRLFSSVSSHSTPHFPKLIIRQIFTNAKFSSLFQHSFKSSLPNVSRVFFRTARLSSISISLIFTLIKRAHCQQSVAKTCRNRPLDRRSNSETPSPSWSELWTLIRPYLAWLLIAAIASSAVAYLNIRIPILLGQLVNQIASLLLATPNGQRGALDFSVLKPVALQLMVAQLGQALSTFICITALSWMGERMSSDLRVRLFSHLLHFPMPFFDAQRSGELSDRLNHDVQEFKSSFKLCAVQGLRTLAQTIGCTVSLWMMSPRMTLLTLGVVQSVIVVGVLFGSLLRRLSFRSQEQSGIAAGVAAEALQNIRTVKVFAMEDAELGLYQTEVQKTRLLNERLGVGIGIFQAVSNLFLNGVVLGVLYGGGQLVASHQLSPGDLMSFLATAQTIQRSLAQFSLVFGSGVKAWASCARILEFLRVDPSDCYQQTGEERIPRHSLTGDIQLHNIHFSYPTRPGQTVLKGLDMHIEGGQTIAICGPSGAGKSTVAALIERLYEPQYGQITLDGRDVRHLDSFWLRRNAIGVISQEPTLFSTSIRENIHYGRPEATEQEIKAAAELANAAEFIEQFPEGYDTLVGEQGVTLSGGQKQRIAIARALIKDPPILILDEATSALDTGSERTVQQALNRVMHGRTVIIIAHRLSTIRNADMIYVLKDGTVAEKGTHDQLVRNRHGLYRSLVREQQSNESAEGGG